jgi:hypothetical protein
MVVFSQGGRPSKIRESSIILPMVLHLRSLRKDTVMCTVQSCPNMAAFLFTAGIERGTVDAYFDDHAGGPATGSSMADP